MNIITKEYMDYIHNVTVGLVETETKNGRYNGR